MKQVKITRKNADAIEKLLLEVNGRAHSFTITQFDEVEELAAEAERKLANILIKQDRVGASATATGAGPSAKSYKHPVATTQLNLLRRSTGWFLVEAARVDVFPKTHARMATKIAPLQVRIAQERFRNRLRDDFGAVFEDEADA